MYYNDVQKRLTSRLFLALGLEGKTIVQENPHTEISKLEFREIVKLAKVSYEKKTSRTSDIDYSSEPKKLKRR